MARIEDRSSRSERQQGTSREEPMNRERSARSASKKGEEAPARGRPSGRKNEQKAKAGRKGGRTSR